ncbi:hypothetical protein INH39_11620 [Massilia violaceinigra]|uniref:Channel forming colicins domain-containing protein n=1 Tax=Massilia violaceinigra TaxID=2045208 RepID=A0ABY4ABT4_9BURK|nr:hypothetical protein [Massilia violaceinigra]UOD32254.1 hypothetical protein INH39_11620 [Massilia violaceinigra]
MGHMFSALVSGNGDVSGALAYADYKRSKIEWRVRFRSQHMHEPDAADEEAFIQIQMLSVNIENFRRRGDRAAAQYLTEALKDKVAPLALEVYQSELSGKFAVLEERVQSSLQQIQSQLNEKKTFGGWMKEIGTAFVSSLALVAIVGAILTGYVGLAKLTASVEKAVGLGTNPAYKAAFEKPISTPRSPQDGD